MGSHTKVIKTNYALMTVDPPSQAAAAPLAALIKYQPVAVVVWYKNVAVSPTFVVAIVIYAPPVAAGVRVDVPVLTEVMNLNCPTAPAAKDTLSAVETPTLVIAAVKEKAVAVVTASTLEKARGAGMDMKTVLTVTFWLEGFELGLSTTWNRSVDARAVFSVNAVIFLSAILFPFGYVLGLSTVKVKLR